VGAAGAHPDARPHANAGPDRDPRRVAGHQRPVTAETYLERLARRSAATKTVLCLGLDPDPMGLPAGFPPGLSGIERFARLLVEVASPFAAAVKPNLAFFEAYGSAGLAALERVRAAIPGDVPVIADAKRGDLGSTAARQAAALFDVLGADAVTVNPYLGSEAVLPLLERLDRYAYLLCRTSNPGAGELQDLQVAADSVAGDGTGGGRDAGPAPAEPLWARVARRATAWGPGGTVGLVVGATAPAELAAIRRIAPGLGFLVPGVGAQGGEVEPVLAHGPARAPAAGGRPGGGLLVNVSRGIAGAANAASEGAPKDLEERLAEAAANWARQLPVLP
jgi:orotidine-5'-phosphate decarboxylase